MTEFSEDFGHLSESDDDDECLRLMLGGISTLDLTPSAWEMESDASDEQDSPEPRADAKLQLRTCQQAVQEPHPRCITLPPECSGEFEAPWFSLAYNGSSTCAPTGAASRPSVRVVDLSSEGRGNALVATRRIASGEVIYTERAAVATQVPQSGSVPIRACQSCFRSLEPASSCQISDDSALPMPHLWPVLDIDFDKAEKDSRRDYGKDGQAKTRHDIHGRVQCQLCESWFCCKHCHDAFESQHDSCCLVAIVVRKLPNFLRLPGRCVPEQQKVDDGDAADEEDGNDAIVAQPALPLAIRMFATLLRCYRTSGPKATFFDGLCGEASDVTALELGVACSDDNNHGSVSYSIAPIYIHLLQVWSVSLEEQKTFTLELFMELAAKAARNGFGIRTQSPFKPYYAALTRSCVGGHGSEQHEELKRRVARALGSEDGNLQRGMDRKVEAKVCPEVVALFPLTARINHACGSCAKAEVLSQEFVDHHIDLVALRDIECGDEITISYIHSGRKSRERRQRELQAKYLFHCDCQRCLKESSTVLVSLIDTRPKVGLNLSAR